MRPKFRKVSATLTRPNTTDQYAAGDEISNSTTAPAILELAGVVKRVGQGGVIRAIQVHGSVNAATDPTLDVFLFDTSHAINNDNAAFAPSDAQMLTCIGGVSMGTAFQSGANNIMFQVRELNLPFVCAAASTSLFARLVERGTYTPASGETFAVVLLVETWD